MVEKKSKILIIIPAYNEGKRIAAVIKGVQESIPQADIVVIDDGSTDNTSRLSREAGARVLSHGINLGSGAATQTGYKYAQRHPYQFVVQLDADGQHDPKCISNLLHALKNGSADMIIGSRFLGNQSYKPSWIRKMGMRVFGAITSLITGCQISDSTSGFRALRREVVEFFANMEYPSDYQDADVITLAHFAGFRIREVPVTMYQREEGKSQLRNFKLIYYSFKMFLSLGVTLLREKPSRKRRI